ncbi:MAG: hypothetical protein MR656_09955, partial [Bacteroidales bacterium]|nr:hypothetical protein [Bacteroidales bacterium]
PSAPSTPSALKNNFYPHIPQEGRKTKRLSFLFPLTNVQKNGFNSYAGEVEEFGGVGENM